MSKLTAREVSDMKRKRAEGWSLMDLAAHFDIEKSTAKHHTDDVTVPEGKRPLAHRPRSIDYGKAQELKARGMTNKAIASRLGVSRVTIWKALKEAA